ncbi:MAG: DNA-protecting protein DprA, partial [Deltaproteobacteria bacterium]|nr:DNA-protecting protein DprA [Deltaproteobacteria bacterium]
MESGRNSQNEQDRLDWLTLKLIPELGSRSLLRLFKHFGSPGAVLRAGLDELASVPALREEARLSMVKKSTLRSPEREWEVLQKRGVTLLCVNDPDYPSNLAAIHDPPPVLFVRGKVEPRDLVSIAVVGSRAASPMGMAFTEKL